MAQLSWSPDGNRLAYSSSDTQGTKSFYIVDVVRGERSSAFDSAKLQEAFSNLGVDPEDADQALEVTHIALTENSQEVVVATRDGSYVFDRQTGQMRKAEKFQGTPSKLFLPPRPSSGNGESTEILIENQLSERIELLWIAAGGNRRSYGWIESGESKRQHTYVGHVWLLRSEDGQLLGCLEAELGGSWDVTDEVVDNVTEQTDRRRNRTRRSSTGSPNGRWSTEVRDKALWLIGDGEERLLASASSDKGSFARRRRNSAPDVYWSPDSSRLVAFEQQQVETRQVNLVESTPEGRLQPRLLRFDYAKPGDEISKSSVHLFSVDQAREIPVTQVLMPQPWSLRFQGWSESSDEFYLLYNERGHQRLRLLAVSVHDGTVRVLVNELSDTFIHYSDSGKLVCESLGGGEFLWASERSGWNHLYRVGPEAGDARAITSGNWNVKRIEKIDRQAEQIWFYAVGIHSDQDPYHEHFCRVNFDGSGFQILTDGDGTHQVRFEQDERFLLDTYSRVDAAPITELRDASDGRLICELERQDTAARFGERRITERFVAKGRDGRTDIWGIIHWPQGFEPDKKYPVVENIYAGPHDHHVPKSFRRRYGHQHRIADAGMIVVQIDGMGTAWRSKSFHDVCFKNLRDAGFPDRIAWIKAAAEKFPQMDLTRVGIYGGSAGGQNAMAALLWHHDFYRVAVADCGCHDNRMDKIWWNEQWMGWPVDGSYAANSNTEHAHLLDGELMLIVGELDRNVDPATTTQVVKELIDHDKDFEFVLVAGAGHGAAETSWGSRKRLDFLKRHLQAE